MSDALLIYVLPMFFLFCYVECLREFRKYDGSLTYVIFFFKGIALPLTYSTISCILCVILQLKIFFLFVNALVFGLKVTKHKRQ